MKDPIYLDHNATTPIDPRVAEAMEPFLHRHFGNPSSPHVFGRRARQAVDRAREQVARLIGARADEIVFTSGGSESNNMVIAGVAHAAAAPVHVVTSSVEHPAVIEPCLALEEQGHRLSVIDVDREGRVDPDRVAAELAPDTVLVTVMHANNEVGTLQPVAQIARRARRRGVLVHTDAAQSLGKVPVDVDALGVDLLSIAGHKLYAPKGVGALYIRRGVRLPNLILGAGHEAGRRAGTESVLLVVGLGEAAALARAELEESSSRQGRLRDLLWELVSKAGRVERHTPLSGALPNTLSVGFRGLAADELLTRVEDRVAASAGAACHPGGVSVSWVLRAMGVDAEAAQGTIRLSLGRGTTEEEVREAAEVLLAAVRALRRG